jgi:hypothetical protein
VYWPPKDIFKMSDDIKTCIAQLSRFRRWQRMTNM